MTPAADEGQGRRRRGPRRKAAEAIKTGEEAESSGKGKPARDRASRGDDAPRKDEPRGDGDARRGRRQGGTRRGGRRLPRLRAGEAIALVAAILLFILMFFDWYGAKATTSAETLGGVVTGSGGGSAWDTLEVIPLFLMLAIVVTVGAAILRLSGTDWKPAIPPAAAICVLGILAAVLILIRIISPPGPEGAFSELAYESTLRLPIFLALAAALGIAYGGWRTMGEEGTSFASIGKSLESPRRSRRQT